MRNRVLRNCIWVVSLCLIFVAARACVAGTETYTIGGEEQPWMASGTLESLEYDPDHGWIIPKRLPPGENLSLTALERGGSARGVFGEDVETFLDGDPYSSYYGWGGPGRITLDLGDRFRVNRIHLYPPPNMWLHRGYLDLKVGINDGDPEDVDGRGRPIPHPIWSGRVKVDADVDIRFPSQIVRYVGIDVDPRDAGSFLIGELEVYGEGFVSKSSYISRIIDFEEIVTLGDILWRGEKDEDAQVLIRTRSGADDDPNVYWRRIKEGEEVRLTNKTESGELMTKEDYEALMSKDRAGITHDIENWSFWSAPYDFEGGLGGVPIVSPAPRRYFQIKIDFFNTPTQAGRMDSLSFRFSRPPSAHEVVAEIHPIHVKPATVTTFTYAVRPRIRGQDTGFDRLEVRTPVRPERIRSVRIDRVDVDFTVDFFEDPTRFVLSFPKIDIDRELLEVDFDCAVLRYGTAFVGRVYDSGTDQVPQMVIPGDAVWEIESDDLSVRTSLDDPLIASLAASPDPFTPNGDGVNDMTEIRYSLLHLTSPAPVRVEIYDLSGVLRRRLYSGYEKSGIYRHPWDGRDDYGRRLPPGIYLCRLSVRSDVGERTRVATVSLVY